MGFFSKLLGKKAKNNSGLWLKGYRECGWQKLGIGDIEFGTDSCYATENSMGWCVMRNYDSEKDTYAYMGCCALKGDDQNSDPFLLIKVIRIEDKSGALLTDEDWDLKEIPNSTEAAQKILNYGHFNDYKHMPPFVAMILMNDKM